MKEFIYTHLTSGNELLGIILAILYCLFPFICICIIAWILSMIYEEIKFRIKLKKEKRK